MTMERDDHDGMRPPYTRGEFGYQRAWNQTKDHSACKASRDHYPTLPSLGVKSRNKAESSWQTGVRLCIRVRTVLHEMTYISKDPHSRKPV
jgi:hypothetical protein